MNSKITDEGIKYLIKRLVSEASDAVKESQKDSSDMLAAGRRLAYYEMLDILRSELLVDGADLKEFGLDMDLEKTFA